MHYRLSEQHAERCERHRPAQRPAGPLHRRPEIDQVADGVRRHAPPSRALACRTRQRCPGRPGNGALCRWPHSGHTLDPRSSKTPGGQRHPKAATTAARSASSTGAAASRSVCSTVRHSPQGSPGNPSGVPARRGPAIAARSVSSGPSATVSAGSPCEVCHIGRGARPVRGHRDQIGGHRRVPCPGGLEHVLSTAQLPGRERDAEGLTRLHRDRRAEHAGAGELTAIANPLGEPDGQGERRAGQRRPGQFLTR